MSYYDYTKVNSQPLVHNLQQQSHQPYIGFDQHIQNPQQQLIQADMMLQQSSPSTSSTLNISQQFSQHLQQPMLPSVLKYTNEDSQESCNNVQNGRKQSMFGADDEASSASSDNSRVSKPSSGPKRRRKPLIKGSDEYKKRRRGTMKLSRSPE